MGKRVSLFVTCIVDQLFRKVGMAMAEVLERLGYTVDFPEDQTCCGQPAFNSGYRAESRTVARHFLEVSTKRVYGGAFGLLYFDDHASLCGAIRERAGGSGACARARSRDVLSSRRFSRKWRSRRRRAHGRRGDVPRWMPRAARTRHQAVRRAGCSPTYAVWNCAR